MRLLIIILLLSPLGVWSQSSVEDTVQDSLPFYSVEQILKDSKNITDETFDLKFLLRSLTDNGWYLKLNKDSTFEYIHWSGWGPPEGTILEKGKYTIHNNLLKIESEKSSGALKNMEFYLATSQTDSMDNNLTTDCVRDGELFYCLYHR